MKKIIYCINNLGGVCNLTIGKEYNIEYSLGDKYIVECDDGFTKEYLKDRFTTSKELADSILDMKNNPSSYYQPIEVALNIGYNIEHNKSTLGLVLLNIDDGLNGVGN